MLGGWRYNYESPRAVDFGQFIRQLVEYMLAQLNFCPLVKYINNSPD